MSKRSRVFAWLGGFFGFSAISVNVLNVPEHVNLWLLNPSPDGLVIAEWQTSLPSCAFDRHLHLIGRPTFVARFVRWFDGSQRLIDSARKSTFPDEAREHLEQVSSLVSFRDDGYHVEFDLAHPRAVEQLHQSAGRDCDLERLSRRPEHLSFTSCDALTQARDQEIARTTATDLPQRYWYSYDYTANFQHLTLDFTAVFCEAQRGVG